MLTEDSGATPLLALMLFSGLLATAAILFVIRRSRRRGLG
jgi:hypothetical protein